LREKKVAYFFTNHFLKRAFDQRTFFKKSDPAGLASAHCRAFTLTEIAIVLGIVGFILGSIWAAASAVYSNMKISQAQEGITYTAQKTRSMFAGSNQTSATGSPQTITSSGMFPVSWVNLATDVIGNPWNQTPAASLSFVVGDSLNPTMFGIELDNISASGCVALISFYNSAASTANGGQVAGLAGTAVVDTTAATGTGVPIVLTNPLAPGFNAATSQCTGTGNTNSIGLIFDMRSM
jgi:type II secretory pathway pseudopilin PulG